jgi:hypothetical protein
MVGGEHSGADKTRVLLWKRELDEPDGQLVHRHQRQQAFAGLPAAREETFLGESLSLAMMLCSLRLVGYLGLENFFGASQICIAGCMAWTGAARIASGWKVLETQSMGTG